MAAFPPLAQIVGKHGGIYEAYYLQADPLGTGSIGALDAANFLKRSKLSDTILSQVWDLSDPNGKGYLEKAGFFVALKLIALAQSKQEMSVAKLIVETPPPDLGPVEAVEPIVPSAHAAYLPWDISLSEKSKYDKVFDSLQPMNNMLAGDKVKPVLMNSKLPVDVLGRIWDMSDIDKDGYLDRDEFAVAMHLVYQAREGQEIPAILRPGLVPPSKRKGAGLGGVTPPMPGAVPVLPMIVPSALPSLGALGRSTPTAGFTVPQIPWVVSAADKANSDMIFNKLDTDHDGLVSGVEIRDIMAQSALPTTVLAHIWGLCDSQSLGKLTAEQFALAMYLIQQKLKGIDPPLQLTPDMIPPTLRSIADPGAFGVQDGTNAGPYSHVADFSAIRELDQISKEIEDIKKEKLLLERDKAQHEADIKIRQSEVQVLQKELDSLTGTLAQLDSQKKEAQKRLDELDDRRSNLERNVQDLRDKADREQMEVNKMKSLLSNREQLIKDQENDLAKLRIELTRLREEESKLEQTAESSKQQLEILARSQGEISNEIVLIRKHIQQLHSQYKILDPGFTGLSGVNGDVSMSVGNSSKIGFHSPASTVGSNSAVSTVTDFAVDPFKGQDAFSRGGALPASNSDPFQSDDPFRDSDPFKSSDPFGSDDPFKDAFGSSSAVVKNEDAFSFNNDPFIGNTQTAKEKSGSGFDAFGMNWDSNSAANKSSHAPSTSGIDPFTSSAKSSALAKNKKAPPPRPAPPKSKSPLPFGSTAVSPKLKVKPLSGFDADPFGSNDPFISSGTKNNTGNSSSDAFANFADFSPGKFEDNTPGWGQ
ncbi:hypothetical protein BsWGS_20184 [Bradybaena similaris]